ncbi:hypothetical protein SCA6_008419 [Theobroma cacao]
MDSVPAKSTVAVLAFTVILFLFCLLWFSRTASSSRNKRRTATEASGAWPIIGHIPLLGGPRPPHLSLTNMADKFGTIFTIKLGVHRALVVSNWEIAKECLTTNDKAFATRPKLAGMEILGYNYAMIAFAPYGPYWRQVRRFATVELLSNHRLDMLKRVRESEVETSLQQLYQLWDKKRSNSAKVLVDMKRWFRDVVLNVILMIIVGKRIPNSSEGDETVKWKKSLDDFSEQSGKFVVSDALPFLRWLDIGGEEKFMKKIAKELDQIHRDPEVWSDPCEFRPERFLTTHKDVDVRGQNFELIPFGSGRRMCPGVSFALQILHLTLANVLHWFDFAIPLDEPVAMREGAGLTSPRATPLEVHITPRLPASLYESTS